MLRAGGAPLAAIVLLGAVLRFATLGVQSFSSDDLFTVSLVEMPFWDMVSTVPETEATPHLFYVIETVVERVLGAGEVEMRILPALAGTLTVPAVYAAGAVGASRRVGLAAAAFTAVNPFLVWYSQDARAYPLLILFVAVGLACLVSFANHGGGRALAGWAAASVAALASHYFALFVIAPEAAWLLLAGPGEPRRRALAVAAPVFTGMALLPLALHQRSAVGDPGGIGDSKLVERVAAIPKNFLVGFSIPAEALVTGLAGALGAAGLVLALRTEGHARRQAASAGALAACGVVLPLMLSPFGFDYVSSRNVIPALVPLAVVLGCGFAAGRLGPLLLGGLAAVSIVTVVGVAAEREYQRRDWRGAARELGPVRGDRALVLVTPLPLGPFQVYFGQQTRPYPTGAPRASEVAVLALAEEQGFGPGSPEPPHGRAPSPPPGFRRIDDIETSTYRLVRFKAPRPTRLDGDRVRALNFPGNTPVYYWQVGSDR